MSFYGGMTKDDFTRFSSTKFIYGYADPRFDEDFCLLPKAEFKIIRLMENLLSPDDLMFDFIETFFQLEEGFDLERLIHLDPRFLVVKSYPVDPKTGEEFIGPPLTVFNSSSYALPFLVRLFDFQYELDYWRSEFKKLGLSSKLQKQIISLLRLGYDGTKLINSFEKFFYINPSSHIFSSNDDFALWQKGLNERTYHKPGNFGITPSILDPLENFIESWSSYEHQIFNQNFSQDTMGTDCSVVPPYDLDSFNKFLNS